MCLMTGQRPHWGRWPMVSPHMKKCSVLMFSYSPSVPPFPFEALTAPSDTLPYPSESGFAPPNWMKNGPRMLAPFVKEDC